MQQKRTIAALLVVMAITNPHSIAFYQKMFGFAVVSELSLASGRAETGATL